MLRVVTWNLWWRFGPWEERQAAIAATLAAVDADVVCLQEVWTEEGGADQASVLADRLGSHAATTPPRFYDGVSFGNAILSRWPVAEVDVTSLPRADGQPGHRMALLAAIDSPFGRVPVVTTHLDWQYDASEVRHAQTDALAAFVAEHRGDDDTGFPPVLTGDLNAVPGSDEVRALTGLAPPTVAGSIFTDAWEAAGDGSPGHTWSSRNPYLVDASWPQRRLDYVLVGWPRPRPLGNVLACRVAGDEPVDGVWPSDHFAVVADLRTS